MSNRFRVVRTNGANYVGELLLAAALAVCCAAKASAVTEYRLVIHEKRVDIADKEVTAVAVNDSIPAPTLEFREGEAVRITVRNDMDTDTSVHWHGLLVPPEMDGVPFVSFPPIAPGAEYVYEFTLRQSGTYWYHAHTGYQEQRGLFGAIVVRPKEDERRVDREYVVVFSDWTNRSPSEVFRWLRAGSDFDSMTRNAAQHVVGAIRRGRLKDFLYREWQSMPDNEISDVAYDAFLVNGMREGRLEAMAGETVRLRVINAAAATYFYVQYAGGAMQLISADGKDVEPIDVDRVLIGIAETYDFVVTVPRDGAFELRATAQDGSGHVSAWLGEGEEVASPDVPRPDYYENAMKAGYWAAMMNTAYRVSGGEKSPTPRTGMAAIDEPMGSMPAPKMGTMPAMKMGMPENPERPLSPYDKLRAPHVTTLPADRPMREITLNLTGNMERYVWSINGETIAADHMIHIRKGENVRFVFVNKTMMHHPMHLHGHFFRVINEQGERSPFKHTVDVPPMGRRVIEFAADEEKDWFFHCHVLYHLDGGMARVVHYEGTEVDPALKSMRGPLYRDRYYAFGRLALLSQMTDGRVEVSNSRNVFSLEQELEWQTWDYEVELTYDRIINRYASLFAGGDFEGGDGDHDQVAVIGARYLLPLNVRARVWIDSDGHVRVGAGHELRLANRVVAFADAEYDTDTQWEYVAGIEVVLTRRFSIIGQHHSAYGLGAGLSMRF